LLGFQGSFNPGALFYGKYEAKLYLYDDLQIEKRAATVANWTGKGDKIESAERIFPLDAHIVKSRVSEKLPWIIISTKSQCFENKSWNKGFEVRIR
jgi:hypothetical protein